MNNTSGISVVAFDLDGLMFDTERLHRRCADILLKRRGYTFTSDLNQTVMGRTPRENLALFKEHFSLPNTLDELVEETIETTLGLISQGYATMPGLLKLFDFLDERKIPRCVCTSGLSVIAHEFLKQERVGERVDFVITSDDVVHGKPDPEIYLKAIKRFGVAPKEMLALEDSAVGLTSAKDAGALCCAVRAEHNKDVDFSKADLVVESLDAPKLLALITKGET
ncbi:MAG: HAD family hydrolase [Thermoguttaceae bacterium]